MSGQMRIQPIRIRFCVLIFFFSGFQVLFFFFCKYVGLDRQNLHPTNRKAKNPHVLVQIRVKKYAFFQILRIQILRTCNYRLHVSIFC